ncbi:MAG TPA: RodZ domain-containing protein [Methylomirabilota bacterium]|nr:RodZ domain-containing protein [Methylomirabilota bacterium]
MASLGSYLRELREGRGLSLEELSRATRVAPRYLEALEADDLAALPGHVFARGFLRAYCQILETPPDEAIALYHRQTGTPLPAPASAGRRVESGARNRSTVLISFVLLVVFGVALLAVANVLQSARERASAREGVAAPGDVATSVTAPVPAEDRPKAPEAQPPKVAAAPQPPPSPPPSPQPAVATPGSGGQYRLVARVSEATWVRVRTDDGRSTEETIPAGAVREWVSSTPFVLTVGNAGGIALELNGQPLPPLGPRGAVISRLVIPSTQQ